jgi:hypothetical protein
VSRYFNDIEIKPNQKSRIDTKGSTSTLTLNKADMPDIGVYKVIADNGKEKIETQANIDVCGMLSRMLRIVTADDSHCSCTLCFFK